MRRDMRIVEVDDDSQAGARASKIPQELAAADAVQIDSPYILRNGATDGLDVTAGRKEGALQRERSPSQPTAAEGGQGSRHARGCPIAQHGGETEALELGSRAESRSDGTRDVQPPGHPLAVEAACPDQREPTRRLNLLRVIHGA